MSSFGHAIRGIRFLIRSERHAQIHLLATVVVVVCGLVLSISAVEWCLVSLAIGLVWATEALNTALERLVDLCSPQHNEVAGHAKDLAAGAVLLAAVVAAVVGLVVFLPRIAAFCEF
jgi:diacylglycerol kinase